MARRFPEEQFLGVKGAYGNQMVVDLPNVTIIDHSDDMKAVYKQTKLLLCPSKYESYGRVAIEAAASGIPSVVSTAQGFAESAISPWNLSPRDYDQWENAIQTVLSQPSLFGSQARTRLDELWLQSQSEIEAFLHQMEQLASLKRKRG
jgi:glycosyltransferase involved in cell wall biosynthesis